MLLQTLVALTLTAICYGSNSKAMKSLPSVSHSFVNLGKIDVSFNFNGKSPDSYKNPIPPNFPVDHSKSEIVVDIPCPCSDLQPPKSFVPQPSELISKVLRSNALFKQPTSTVCCNSHEEEHEDFTVIEMGSNKNNLINNRSPIKPFPPLFVDMLPKRAPQFKPKAIEVILFPKRKDLVNFDFIKTTASKPNQEIQIVGDKPLHNDVKEIPEIVTSTTIDFKVSNDEKKEAKEILSNDFKTNTLDA